MNLGQYLFGSLQEMGRVELPNFGVVSLQKKSASLKEEDATLLPPTYEILIEKNDSILNSDFAKYISDDFTSEMEDGLDKIADGKLTYKKLLTDFYKPFQKEIKEKD